GLSVVVVISLLLLLWRLSSSPIQLNQFVPRIEQAASDLPGGLSVKLESIGMFWNRSEKQIDLKALDVKLLESSGSSLVSAPAVDISLSVFALMRGVVALSSIELNDVDVQLVRREDGSFQIFRKTDELPVVTADNKPRDFSENVRHMFKVMAMEEDSATPLSYLKRIKLKGSLEVEDRKSGLNWAADAVESLFVGHKGEIKGDLGVRISSPQVLKGIHTDIDLSIKGDSVTASLAFTGIKPAKIATLDNRLAALASLDLSLDGNINTKLTLPDKIHTVSANITSGAGQVSYQDYYPEPLKLSSLGLDLSVDIPGKSVHVSSLDALLGDGANPLKLHVSGSAQMLEKAVAVKLQALLQQLQVNEFDLYWPRDLAQGARKWLVSNMKAGTVDNATLDLALQVPRGSETNFKLGELKGSVDYSDLTVSYFGELPPATGLTGSGTFNQEGFDLGVSRGMINDVNIDRGTVVISGMDVKKAAISISTHLNGPLANLFAVLEAPPLKLGSESVTGLVSRQLSGQVTSDFSISLPLKSGLSDEEIKYQATGKISDGVYRKIVAEFDLQAANLEFKLDQSKINLTGPLAFSGVPLTIDWTTFMNGPDKGHAEFTVDAPNVTGTQISALGYDVAKYMQGGMAVKANASLVPGEGITASIESDLNNAALAVPQIYWSKPAGAGGDIGFTMLVEKNHIHAKDIKVELGKVKTSGNVEIDIAGPVMSLTLEQLALTNAQLNGLKLERKKSKDLLFTLQGGEVSLEPILSRESRESDPVEKQVAVESEALAKQLKSSGILFEIGESKLDKVYINSETYFDNIEFSGRRDSEGWQEIRVSGHNPFAEGKDDTNSQPAATAKLGSGQFRLAFGPDKNGQYPLQIEAEDLGSIVSAVKGRDIMKSGYLVLDGDSQGPLFTKPIQADFKLNYFTVREAPAISSVLNLASLSQIISTFRQTGLAFNSASGDLQLDGSRLSTQQVQMNGGSLGVTASGWMELKQKQLELKGVVIPLSKLNNIVGKIPLLGQVVVGKDGNGIMAIDYTVTGTLTEPKASIRKESLTPQMLEKTLGTDKPGSDPKQQ
ncbi:MAG: AsmA-like C-terminal domain-containing protein, partial [Xanthomonadales bacterium]|nr:AsmA-like C-terminal domain-containing protein [Xanthomonadales bacterium]